MLIGQKSDKIYTGYIEDGVHYYMHYVPYSETDAGGVVYHGRYFDIAERARNAILAVLGFETLKKEVILIIHSVDARYFKPLKVADIVEIRSNVIELKSVSMTIEQSFYVSNELKTTLKVKVVIVGNNFMPTRMPEDILNKFKLINKGD